MKIKSYIFILILCCFSFLSAAPDTLNVVQGKMRSPVLALSMSAILPGGGQVYNQKWLKAGVFMTAEVALGGVAAWHYYNHVNGDDSSIFFEEDALSTAKRFTWFFAAVYVYSLMDAYVDAHLSNFPNERLILEPDPDINGVKLSLEF